MCGNPVYEIQLKKNVLRYPQETQCMKCPQETQCMKYNFKKMSSGTMMVDGASQVLLGSGLTILSQLLM